MTPEQQRIAIAEACGWKEIRALDRREPQLKLWLKHLVGRAPGSISNMDKIPDYLNDLNAMREAEKVLKPEQMMIYAQHLKFSVWHYHAYMATASQRAEAFLRTLNLWNP